MDERYKKYGSYPVEFGSHNLEDMKTLEKFLIRQMNTIHM